MNLTKKLEILYNDASKHSNYQNVPEFVSNELGYSEVINEEWRGDSARYFYLNSKLKNMNIKSISDIGANTGFFSLSLANQNSNILCNVYEINRNYCSYIKIIKDHFDLKNIKIYNKGICLSNILELHQTDVVINFNVLHHAGVDFDKNLIKRQDDFKPYAIKYLNKFKHITNIMFFQMGYNWGGDKSQPIINSLNVFKFIKWNQQLFKSAGWELSSVAVHDHFNKKYRVLNPELLNKLNDKIEGVKLDDFFDKIGFAKNSEFYKRPIFILTHKKY